MFLRLIARWFAFVSIFVPSWLVLGVITILYKDAWAPFLLPIAFLVSAFILGLVLQAVIRLTIWVRKVIKTKWNDFTPPYDGIGVRTAKRNALKFLGLSVLVWWVGWVSSVFIVKYRPPIISKMAEYPIVRYIITVIAFFFQSPISIIQDLPQEIPSLGSEWNTTILILMIVFPTITTIFGMANIMQYIEYWHIKFYRMLWHLRLIREEQLQNKLVEKKKVRAVIIGFNIGCTLVFLYWMLFLLNKFGA